MKTSKKVIFVLILVIAIVLIIARFLPSQQNVSRSLFIHSTREKIFDEIKILKNWSHWSPWQEQDSAAVYTYNNLVGAGARMEWEGKVVGKGNLTIVKVSQDSICYRLEFTEPWTMHSDGYYSLVSAGDSLKITWSDISTLPWPIGRIMGLFMDFDKMMGPYFEKGLQKLKKTVESYQYSVYERTTHPVNIVSIRHKMNMGDNTSKILGDSYAHILAFISKNKLHCTGAPMAITLAWDSLSWDFEAAIPVDKIINGNEEICVKTFSPGRAIGLEFHGAYEKTYAAYKELDRFMKEHRLIQNGGPWEVYISDPTLEPDTNKWITEIYFPVRE